MKKVIDKSNRLKALVKPNQKDEGLVQEAQFLCQEHNASCRRNSSIVDDDDILF